MILFSIQTIISRGLGILISTAIKYTVTDSFRDLENNIL
jgi:hypothetical protein